MDESERYLLQERLPEIQPRMQIVWGKHDRVCNNLIFSQKHNCDDGLYDIST